MPLFEMPKPKVVQNIKEEVKTQKTQNFTAYTECFALCGASSGKIIFIAAIPGRPKLIFPEYGTLSNDVEGLVFFAINKALNVLKYYSKNITIYSGYTYDDIVEYAKIKEHSNMNRYQCKMIIDKVTNDFTKVIFKKECPYSEVNELMENIKKGVINEPKEKG